MHTVRNRTKTKNKRFNSTKRKDTLVPYSRLRPLSGPASKTPFFYRHTHKTHQFWGPPHHSSLKEDNKTLKKKPFGGSQLLPLDKANKPFFLDSSLLQMSFDFVTTPNDLKKMHACSIALSLSLALSRRSLALALALAPSIVLALAHHPHTIRTSSTHHPHIICLTRYCS